MWGVHGAALYPRASRLLQTRQPRQRMLARIAAHLHRRLQPATESRALGSAEHLATQRLIKLHTRHTGRLAMRHAGQGRGDGRGDTAGGAGGAAVHCCFCLLREAAATSFLIASLCAFRSAFQKTRLNSFKCFHHWGAGVRVPFFTFAIS